MPRQKMHCIGLQDLQRASTSFIDVSSRVHLTMTSSTIAINFSWEAVHVEWIKGLRE